MCLVSLKRFLADQHQWTLKSPVTLMPAHPATCSVIYAHLHAGCPGRQQRKQPVLKGHCRETRHTRFSRLLSHPGSQLWGNGSVHAAGRREVPFSHQALLQLQLLPPGRGAGRGEAAALASGASSCQQPHEAPASPSEGAAGVCAAFPVSLLQDRLHSVH